MTFFHRLQNISVNGGITKYGVPFTIDSYGVERTFEPFYLQPTLYQNITYDIFEADPEVPPTERAELMLADDMLNNSKLKITWDIAVLTNPTYNSVSYALQI
jgi:hypothetical protein